MITAPWGTPEYAQQQHEMRQRQAAAEQQRQDVANAQMRRQQAEQKVREDSQRKHLDTMAGISGQSVPMYGNYDAFQHGRNMVGRDHNGKFPTYTPPQAPSHPSARSDGGNFAAVLIAVVAIIAIVCLLRL